MISEEPFDPTTAVLHWGRLECYKRPRTCSTIGVYESVIAYRSSTGRPTYFLSEWRRSEQDGNAGVTSNNSDWRQLEQRFDEGLSAKVVKNAKNEEQDWRKMLP